MTSRDSKRHPLYGNRSLIVNSPYKGLTINDPSSWPRALRFSEMGPPEPRGYVIGGLVPEAHTTVIYGDGGVAKSTLVLSASLTVANGGHSWLGHPVEGGPVLYLDFELDAQEQNRRVKQLARAEGLSGPPDSLLYMGALGYKARAAFEAALESCKESGARLMILDSLGLALHGDAEAARDVIGFYQNVLEPFRAQGITVVIVDHQSKPQAGQRYQSKRAFGSVFKGNLARSVIQVEPRDRWENKLSLRMRQVKHNFGPLADPFGVELSFTEEVVTVERAELEPSAMAEEQTLNAEDRVVYALRDGPSYPGEVAEATGLAQSSVKVTLSKLRKAGKVEPTGMRGKFGAEQVRLSLASHKTNDNDPADHAVGFGDPDYEEVHDSEATRRKAPTSVPLVDGIYHHGPECGCEWCAT
jgi:DNA-binding transcriptional ArsR family regulator